MNTIKHHARSAWCFQTWRENLIAESVELPGRPTFSGFPRTASASGIFSG